METNEFSVTGVHLQFQKYLSLAALLYIALMTLYCQIVFLPNCIQESHLFEGKKANHQTQNVMKLQVYIPIYLCANLRS